MDYTDELLPLAFAKNESSIIKVIGVGGGGSNAVNHMYRQGITDVTFVVCNTDNQALASSPVPIKIQLGVGTTEGLGAGAVPEKARTAAEEDIERIREVLKDNTKMVFITAGMGGGTGTGASPVVARVARELGILTVGIVTIPFAFEGKPKILQALEGVAHLNEHVDALLVINNEKLREIDPTLTFKNAYAKADEVLSNAAKAIAEIVTVTGYINIDFADVYTIMKDGHVAIMNTGEAAGENRIQQAISNALKSPLLNTDVHGANKILLSLYCSGSDEHQIKMEELSQIHEFMEEVGENVQVIWGQTFDDSLGENVKITLIATGFKVENIPGMTEKIAKSQPKKNEPKEVVETYETLDGEVEYVVKTTEPETPQELTEEEKEKEIKDAMENLYKTTVQQQPVASPKKEETPPLVIELNDLDDEQTLTEIENIPAWKRRKM